MSPTTPLRRVLGGASTAPRPEPDIGPARTTIAHDVTRAAESADASTRLSGPLVSHAVRGQVTAVAVTDAPVRTASALIGEVETLRERRTGFEEQRRQELTTSRSRHRLHAAEEFDKGSSATGFLGAWVPSIILIALPIAMVGNDPGFVYSTIREVLDVPVTTSFLDVSDPKIIVSLAAAVVVTATLLGAAYTGGKALGMLLFDGPLLRRADDHPEAVRSREVLGRRGALVVAILSLVVLTAFTGFLHTIASARLMRSVTATFGGASEVAATLVWLITLLPWVVLVFDILASAPQLAHARKAARWSRGFRWRERFDLLRDRALLRRERAVWREAHESMLTLTETIRDVGRRSLAEIAEASITTGHLDLTPVAEAMTATPNGDGPGLAPQRELPLDLSGSHSNPFLPGVGVVSNHVADVINRWHALPAPPVRPPLADFWAALRAQPLSYAVAPAPESASAVPHTQASTADAGNEQAA